VLREFVKKKRARRCFSTKHLQERVILELVLQTCKKWIPVQRKMKKYVNAFKKNVRTRLSKKKNTERILASFSISMERRDREVGVESVMD